MNLSPDFLTLDEVIEIHSRSKSFRISSNAAAYAFHIAQVINEQL
jgi:hypothetical protein